MRLNKHTAAAAGVALVTVLALAGCSNEDPTPAADAVERETVTAVPDDVEVTTEAPDTRDDGEELVEIDGDTQVSDAATDAYVGNEKLLDDGGRFIANAVAMMATNDPILSVRFDERDTLREVDFYYLSHYLTEGAYEWVLDDMYPHLADEDEEKFSRLRMLIFPGMANDKYEVRVPGSRKPVVEGLQVDAGEVIDGKQSLNVELILRQQIRVTEIESGDPYLVNTVRDAEYVIVPTGLEDRPWAIHAWGGEWAMEGVTLDLEPDDTGYGPEGHSHDEASVTG